MSVCLKHEGIAGTEPREGRPQLGQRSNRWAVYRLDYVAGQKAAVPKGHRLDGPGRYDDARTLSQARKLRGERPFVVDSEYSKLVDQVSIGVNHVTESVRIVGTLHDSDLEVGNVRAALHAKGDPFSDGPSIEVDLELATVLPRLAIES